MEDKKVEGGDCDIKKLGKKIYDFFCIGGVHDGEHFHREAMTEEKAKEYAKYFELRYEEVDE